MSSSTNPYMNFIIWPDAQATWQTDRVGGKASGIYQLKKMGLEIPDFFVLSADLWSYWHGTGEWPTGFIPALQRVIKDKNFDAFSVRSSSLSEDLALRSHAGVFHTELNVSWGDVEQAIINVYMSAQQGSAVYGRNQLVPMAVIIQKMVMPDCSGVAFTRKPQGHSGIFCIEAWQGMGTSAADGTANVQTYEWDRFGDRLNKVYESEFMPLAQQREMVQTGLKIEKHFGAPMDFEWSVVNKVIHFLQARPITATLPPLMYYADTTLSERYPGSSRRLTCDFAQKVYGQLYYDAAEFLGASPERLEILKPYYAKMIEAKAGHLYYNLNSYFTALSALPGGGKQLDYWSGPSEGFLKSVIQLPKYPRFTFSEILKVTWSFFKLTVNYDSLAAEFVSIFRKKRIELKNKISAQTTAQEFAQLFLNEVENPIKMSIVILTDLLILKETNKGKKMLSESQHSLPYIELEILIEEIIQDMRDESKETNQKIESFLELYGDCGFEDFKLESRTFRSFPETFHKYLEEKAKLPMQRTVSSQAQGGKLPQDWLGKLISRREDFRLIRSVYYGFYREMIISMWRCLFAENKIDPDSLRYEKWWEISFDNIRSFASGTISGPELIRLASEAAEQTHRNDFPEVYCHPAEGDFQPYFVTADEMPIPISDSIFLGTGVSAGTCQGEVLVLRTPKDLSIMNKIENKILVTASADPAWSGLLPHAMALISERGTLLSHISIISRELKVPAIMNLRNATRTLNTGDLIKIDGSTGQVEIMSKSKQNRT